METLKKLENRKLDSFLQLFNEHQGKVFDSLDGLGIYLFAMNFLSILADIAVYELEWERRAYGILIGTKSESAYRYLVPTASCEDDYLLYLREILQFYSFSFLNHVEKRYATSFASEYQVTNYLPETLCSTELLQKFPGQKFKSERNLNHRLKREYELADLEEIVASMRVACMEEWYQESARRSGENLTYYKEREFVLRNFNWIHEALPQICGIGAISKKDGNLSGVSIGVALSRKVWVRFLHHSDRKVTGLSDFLFHHLSLRFSQPYENDGAAGSEGLARYKEKFSSAESKMLGQPTGCLISG